MQLHSAVFFTVQAVASSYALARGGAPERLVALALGATAIATWAVPIDLTSFHTVEWIRLMIDLALLAAVTGIAMFANRYWPIWVAAVQLDTVAVHGVRAYDPTIWALVYASLLGWAAYPIILILVVGTHRHRARETRTGQLEASWI